jgi:hypothetical protein
MQFFLNKMVSLCDTHWGNNKFNKFSKFVKMARVQRIKGFLHDSQQMFACLLYQEGCPVMCFQWKLQKFYLSTALQGKIHTAWFSGQVCLQRCQGNSAVCVGWSGCKKPEQSSQKFYAVLSDFQMSASLLSHLNATTNSTRWRKESRRSDQSECF